MTTIIQSCVETQFIETTTVKLKVASQKTLEFSNPSCTNFSNLELKNKANKQASSPNTTSSSSNPVDLGGWSFLQALSNVSSNPKDKMEKENVYVHPLTRTYSSSSRLSEKSLELCTENLGCETGSDIMDCNILTLSLSPSDSSSKNEKLSPRKEQNLPPQVEYSSPKNNNYKVTNNSPRKFPPPLTTLSSNGTSSLQFRPHREEGRLVITAVEAPSRHAYFKAERSQGRLRLTFLEDHATKFDSQVSDIIEENEVDHSEEDDYEEESVELDNDFSNEDHHHHHQLDEDDDDHDEESGAYTSKDISGNIFDIEVEVGMEKFQRLINSRCNEGGHRTKGLCNWEPLWVATS